LFLFIPSCFRMSVPWPEEDAFSGDASVGVDAGNRDAAADIEDSGPDEGDDSSN
jgi:hypothetical protein